MRDNYKQPISTSYTALTTRGKVKSLENVGPAIEKYLTLNHGDGGDKIEQTKDGVIVLKGEMDDIPSFAHPLPYKDKIIIDGRAFVNKEGKIKDLMEYHLLQRRALAELSWINNPDELGAYAEMLADIFSSWFANGLARRLNMDIQTTQKLKILSAVYYLHYLHHSQNLDTDDCITRLLRVIPKAMRIPAQMVDDTFTGIEDKVADLYLYQDDKAGDTGGKLLSLLEIFNEITNGEYKLEINVVYNSLTRGAFLAINSPDLAAVAIEHPPLFALMVWYALQKGPQGKTSIGITALGVARKHNETQFINYYNRVLTAQ